MTPDEHPYFIFSGSLSGDVATLKQATCASGTKYVGYTTAPTVSCTCWAKGNKLSEGYKEEWCAREFLFGMNTSSLILNYNCPYMENGFVFGKDTVEFSTPGTYHIYMPSFTAPRAITFHERVLVKTPVIYGKDLLDFHTLETQNQYSGSTRIVQTAGYLSVVIGHFDGDLILEGESITAAVATCSASSTIFVNGTSTLAVGCVIKVSATPGSRVIIRSSTIVVDNAERFTIGGSGTIRARAATLAFDAFDGVVALGDGCSVECSVDGASNAVFVSTSSSNGLRRTTLGVEHRVETSAAWSCQCPSREAHTQRWSLRAGTSSASSATRAAGSGGCAPLGTATLR